MRYIDIENALYKLKPIFTSKDIKIAGFKVYPVQLNQWAKEGYIKKLGAGYYVFTKSEVSPEYVANTLRQPSYISLEYALYYYNLTVDVPFQITSVTTKNTRNIKIDGQNFIYCHIKPQMFNGFVVKKNKDNQIGQFFQIATPEKALVDFFYFNPEKLNVEADFEEARFHEEDLRTKIDWRGVFSLAVLFKNKALERRLYDFKKYIFAQ